MLSKKLFQFINKLALLAMVFTSLAPTISNALGISHALVLQNGTNSFAQEVCTSTGEKVVIQVITSKGKQLATEFEISRSSPKTMPLHLAHCPFCGSTTTTASLPANNLLIITLLAETAQKLAIDTSPMVVSAFYVSPPSQAPPKL